MTVLATASSPLLKAIPSEGDFTHSLSTFLTEHPEHIQNVLIVNDHPEDPYQLVSSHGACFNGVPTMTIHEYDRLLHSKMPRKPHLVVMSFAKCEEKATTTELAYSKNCLYGRHMDSSTVVMCQLFTETSPGCRMIRHHANSSRVLLSKYYYDRMLIPKSSVRFDSLTDRQPNSFGSDCNIWDSGWQNPPFKKESTLLKGKNPVFKSSDRYSNHYKKPLTASCINRLTALSIENYSSFPALLSLPWVTNASVFMLLDTERTTSCNSRSGSTFEIDLPRVDNLWIESTGKGRFFLDSEANKGMGRKNSSTEKAVLTFGNREWNPSSPYRTKGREEIKTIGQNYRVVTGPSLDFTKRFGILHFRGVGDDAIKHSVLSFANTLYWERCILTIDKTELLKNVKPNTNEYSYLLSGLSGLKLEKLNLNCSNLSNLILTSAVRTDEYNTMPTFQCLNLSFLKLVSLQGSTTLWDIKKLLQEYRPPMLITVIIHGYWWLSKEEAQPSITTNDLDFIRPVVENLSVKGHLPQFVLSQSGKETSCRTVYPKLKHITIDVSRVPLSKSACNSSPNEDTLILDFNNSSFPMIETVSLVVPYGGSEGVTTDMKTLMLFVSPRCNRVEVSSTLLSNDKQLVINGDAVHMGDTEGVQETNRTGRVWERRINEGLAEFRFEGFNILEELEDSIPY